MASTGSGQSDIAARYATALFELADDSKLLDQVAEDLTQVRAMLAGSQDLQRLVSSPVISRDEQSRAILAVLERAGIGDLSRRFIGLVAANRRLFALSGMIDAYLAELARRRGEVTAEVTAAADLSAQQRQSLIEQLRKSFGQKIAVNITVDPALLGGMIVKVGSRMVDSSLRTKLSRLQLAMKGIG